MNPVGYFSAIFSDKRVLVSLSPLENLIKKFCNSLDFGNVKGLELPLLYPAPFLDFLLDA
jgi:hypothetical protein